MPCLFKSYIPLKYIKSNLVKHFKNRSFFKDLKKKCIYTGDPLLSLKYALIRIRKISLSFHFIFVCKNCVFYNKIRARWLNCT